jgi:hypothetical protein
LEQLQASFFLAEAEYPPKSLTLSRRNQVRETPYEMHKQAEPISDEARVLSEASQTYTAESR